jgi:hypothetical protein
MGFLFVTSFGKKRIHKADEEVKGYGKCRISSVL